MSQGEPGRFEFGSSHPPSVLGTVQSRRGWLFAVAGVVVAAAGAGYLYYDRELAAKLLKGTPFAPAPRVTTVYKWQDTEGNWQITDRAPTGEIAYEVLQYDSDTNVMPLVPREED